MFSTEEYLLSWGMYLLGSLGLLFVWWRMTGWIRPVVLRNMLRVSAAVALLTPYPVAAQEGFLAPALMMTFLEGLFYEDLGFTHAGIPLVLAIVIANILYLIVDLATQPWRRKRAAKREDGKGESPRSTEARGREAPDQERKTPTLSL